MADLAGGTELIEGGGDFFRLHQGIGTMEKEGIQVFHAETAEAAIDSLQNMFFREIIHLARHDAAFGLNPDTFTVDARGGKGFAEVFFADAAAVDIGVVEVGDAVFDAEGEMACQLVNRNVGGTPETGDECRNLLLMT